MNRSAREGKSVKRFERSSGPDIALYKNYLYIYLYHTTKLCTEAAQPVRTSIWIGWIRLIHRESLEGRQTCSEGNEPCYAGPSPHKETPVDQRRDPRHHWRAPHSPPMWQQGPGTTSCYQTQTTTTTRWDRLVQPHNRRGRRRESHWKQCSALPYHTHTHRPDCIQATTCDCQGRIVTLRSNGPTPQMERPLPRTVQQPCSTTRSGPHGRSCQCYTRPLCRLYPTNGRRDIGAIRKVKKNRAPGICGITAELLKSGGAPSSAGYFLSSHSSGSTVLSPLTGTLPLFPTLERKRLKIRLHQIPRHITSVCSGQGFCPHMSRTYEENNLCEAAAASERLYPWPIHTWPDSSTQTPSWATTWIPPTSIRRLYRPQSCIWLSGPQLPLEHS